MNKIKENLYLNLRDSKVFLKMGLIAIVVILVAYAIFIIPYQIGSKYNTGSSLSISIIVFGFMAIVILLIAIGAPRGSFTFSLRNGSTRKDYFWGTTIFYIIISAIVGISNTLIFTLEKLSFNYLGISQINNYSFIFNNFNFTTAIRLTLYNFLIMLAICSFMNMISFIAYKTAEYGWVVILLVLAAISIKGLPMGIAFLMKLPPTDFNYNIIDLIITIASLTTSYFIIIKTQLRNI